MKRLLIILLISITNVSYGQWVEQNVNFEQLSQINSGPLNENSEVKPVKSYKKDGSMKLHELVNLFLPDEGNTTNIVEWDNIEKTDIIKDLSALESFDGKKYIRLGMAEISLVLGPDKSEDVYQDVYLSFYGNNKGYSEFEISVDCAKCFHENEDYTPEDLFSQIGELQGNEEIYHLKINGKVDCWFFIIRQQCGGRNHWADEFRFQCFLNKSDALNNKK